MKLLILTALAVALHAEDAPKPTVEQQEITKLQQQVAETQAELAIYQRATFQCQANEIHAQAVSSAKQSIQRRPGVDPPANVPSSQAAPVSGGKP